MQPERTLPIMFWALAAATLSGAALAARVPPPNPTAPAAPTAAAQPQAPKYAPMMLLSVKATPDGPLLTWEPVAGTKEYRVNREVAGSGRSQQVATVPGNTTQWLDKGQAQRAMYSVKAVLPNDSKQPMAASNAMEFVPNAPAPARPLTIPSPALLKPLVAPAAGTPPPAQAAPQVSAGPTDVLDKNFSLDGKPPQRESFGFGLTSAGNVQVALQWQGGPVTVSLRPADGNTIASRPLSSGKDVVNFAVSAAQASQSPVWFVDISAPGVAQGQVHIVSPRADAAKMNAVMADARAQQERQRQQAMASPPNSATLAAEQARSAAMQKAQDDALAASMQRILANERGLRSKAASAKAAAPAVPAISGVSLSDPNDSGPLRAMRVVSIDGVGFAPGDKVFMSALGREIQAAYLNTSLNSDQRLVVTLPRTLHGSVPTQTVLTPAAGAFAQPTSASIYIRRGNNVVGNRWDFLLAPELQQLTLDLKLFAYAINGDSTRFEHPDSVSISAGKFGVISVYREAGHFFGNREDHEFFRTTALRNGWVVKSASLVKKRGPKSWDAQITNIAAGTSSLAARVHFWSEPVGLGSVFNSTTCHYQVSFTGEGPVGMPYHL